MDEGICKLGANRFLGCVGVNLFVYLLVFVYWSYDVYYVCPLGSWARGSGINYGIRVTDVPCIYNHNNVTVLIRLYHYTGLHF